METVRPNSAGNTPAAPSEVEPPKPDATARLRLNELACRFAQTPTRRLLVEFLELRRALG